MGGGTLNFKLSNNATADADAFKQTQLTANTSSIISVNQNGNWSQSTALDLGGTSAWNVRHVFHRGLTLPTTGVLKNTAGKTYLTNGVITTAANGGYAFATVGGGANFATINNSTAVIGAVTPTASTYGATANTLVGATDTASAGESLTFGSGNSQVAFTGTNAITTGGILLSSASTGATDTITGGTLEAGSSGKTLRSCRPAPLTSTSPRSSPTTAGRAR